jgi:hypothetical protein
MARINVTHRGKLAQNLVDRSEVSKLDQRAVIVVDLQVFHRDQFLLEFSYQIMDDPSHDDSPVIFISIEGQPGIEIGLDQVSPGAIARAFSVSSYS